MCVKETARATNSSNQKKKKKKICFLHNICPVCKSNFTHNRQVFSSSVQLATSVACARLIDFKEEAENGPPFVNSCIGGPLGAFSHTLASLKCIQKLVCVCVCVCCSTLFTGWLWQKRSVGDTARESESRWTRRGEKKKKKKKIFGITLDTCVSSSFSALYWSSLWIVSGIVIASTSSS